MTSEEIRSKLQNCSEEDPCPVDECGGILVLDHFDSTLCLVCKHNDAHARLATAEEEMSYESVPVAF